mgnify:CR=1 FL=1
MNKLTLYISKNDIEFAKAHARYNGTSVSKLVSRFFFSLRQQVEKRDDDAGATRSYDTFLEDFRRKLVDGGYHESSLSEDAAKDAHMHAKYLNK